MGTVEIGDVVFAEDGSPTKITHVSEIFHKPCYRVTFSDGAEVIATGDHLWHVYDSKGGPSIRGTEKAWHTLSTDELLQLSSRCIQTERSNRYRVRCDAVIDFPEADLPIDPYILGYWLGDGNSHKPSITVGERDIQHLRDQIDLAGYRVVSETYKTSKWGSGYDLWIANDAKRGDGIESRLLRLGVSTNRKHGREGEKHIPECYMHASAKQREALLAGLLDSDGNISTQPVVGFANVNGRLARDVHQLTRSLGIRSTLVAPSGDDVCYHVFWTPTFDPFRMERKSAVYEATKDRPLAGRRSDLMSIVSIEPVDMVPTRCIRVDHPSHVFLVGLLFTPTHNSLMQIDSIYTALRVISNLFIKMGEPRAYTTELTEDNEPYRVWAADQPQLLTSPWSIPNRGFTLPGGRIFNYDGWRRTIISLGLFSDNYWLTITRDSGGFPTMMEVLHPAFVDPKPIKIGPQKGQVEYFYGSGRDKVKLDIENVTWMPFMAFPGAIRGLSSVEYLGVSAALALAAMEFGQRWFAQGASPSYILSTDMKLGQPEVERIARKFLIEHSGLANSHLPLVLDSGLKATKVMSTPDEAQFLGTLEYARSIVAAWFGLPPHLVGGANDKGNVWGKRLDIATPLPTPTGWTTMGDTAPGTVLLGADGKPTTVTFATEIELATESYRVSFNDGSYIDADAEHLWETRNYQGHTAVRTTREIRDTLRTHSRQDLNHKVRVAEALDLPERDLPIDPYFLGLWLGDGATAGNRISVDERDRQAIERLLGHLGREQTWASNGPHCFTVSIKGAHKELRLAGLLGNKHIPSDYLRASESQRLALLQGLMDSDGYAVRTRPRCEFENVDERLVAGVLELARSLGLRPSLGKYRSTKHGVEYGPLFRVGFDPKGLRVFGLDRKQASIGTSVKASRAGFRTITSVEPIAPVLMRCIQVDNEEHLFLAGEGMIPTHNTVAEQGMQLVDVTMPGYIVPCEQALTSLIPDPYKAAFDESYIQRADPETLAKQILADRTGSVRTPNEIRIHDRHLGPKTGGDELFAPLNSNATPNMGQVFAEEVSPDLGIAAPPADPAQANSQRVDNLHYLAEAVERIMDGRSAEDKTPISIFIGDTHLTH